MAQKGTAANKQWFVHGFYCPPSAGTLCETIKLAFEVKLYLLYTCNTHTVAFHTKVKVAHVMVPELISILDSQHTGDRSHKPGGRLSLLSARPAVTSPAAEHNRPLAGTKL